MSDQPASASIQELSCEKCRELLSDYIDRELTDAERASVEKHLATCPKCGSESQRIIGLKKVVQHWGGVKGSGEFRSAVVQQMIRESQQMSSAPFIEGAGPSTISPDNGPPQQPMEPEPDVKTLPPVWILLVAVALAVVAYFIVVKLRGL